MKFAVLLVVCSLCSLASAYPSDEIITDARQIPSLESWRDTVDIPVLGVEELPREEAMRRALDRWRPLKEREIYFRALCGDGDSTNRMLLQLFKNRDFSFGSLPVREALANSPVLKTGQFFPYLNQLSPAQQGEVAREYVELIHDRTFWRPGEKPRVGRLVMETMQQVLRNALAAPSPKKAWQKTVDQAAEVLAVEGRFADKVLLRRVARTFRSSQTQKAWQSVRRAK